MLSSTLNFQSLINQWEKMESNHPNHNGNRFTVCTATSTEYSPITRKPRVSNMFIVLCFPLGCFMPCQPHEVVSDIYALKAI